ncbi:glycosyltransferase family 4 protein [Magnetovibrio sp. PR-2]|uniref:glycosyltransferase family 4 protein n=1 Tax=Magnetovibrio sp. PR-2 TaxID=3120356 RepID=UPI002FCE6244
MPKMLITVTEDWAFLSHRVPTAMAARDAGYDVSVVARMRDHRDKIEELGFRTIPWNIKRESQNPLSELSALWDLIRIYRAEKPDASYHVAIKSIMYGSIAARMAGVKRTFNLFSGMGVVFISNSAKFQTVRAAVTPVLRWALKPQTARLQVQNGDDRNILNGLGIATAERTDLIPGSGLDMENFPATGEMDAFAPKAVVVSRMLWDKGIGELAKAARLLKDRGTALDIILVGAPDPANPASISEDQLKAWQDEGLMDWWGRRDDVAEIYKHAHIAVLPSYREGMPRALLEAASIGRPLVAFDTPGCRDLVRDGENGFLVPFQDVEALSDALNKLAKDKTLRQTLGQAARQDVENIYCAEAIRKQLTTIFSR